MEVNNNGTKKGPVGRQLSLRIRISGCIIPATPGGGGVGPPTENGLSIFDPDDALATV